MSKQETNGKRIADIVKEKVTEVALKLKEEQDNK